MRKHALAVLVSSLGVAGLLAPAAGAAPVITICGSAQVTVNGSDVVNQATCQVLPPA